MGEGRAERQEEGVERADRGRDHDRAHERGDRRRERARDPRRGGAVLLESLAELGARREAGEEGRRSQREEERPGREGRAPDRAGVPHVEHLHEDVGLAGEREAHDEGEGEDVERGGEEGRALAEGHEEEGIHRGEPLDLRGRAREEPARREGAHGDRRDEEEGSLDHVRRGVGVRAPDRRVGDDEDHDDDGRGADRDTERGRGDVSGAREHEHRVEEQ